MIIYILHENMSFLHNLLQDRIFICNIMVLGLLRLIRLGYQDTRIPRIHGIPGQMGYQDTKIPGYLGYLKYKGTLNTRIP